MSNLDPRTTPARSTHLLVMTTIVSLLGIGTADAATILVPTEQPTLQAGIDVAAPGDVVLVAAGSYSGSGNENLDFGGKDIELRSESGPAVTTIQGPGVPEDGIQPRAFQFLSSETPAALVEGFTIRDFHVIDTPVAPLGGGAVVIVGESSPTFRNCAFLGNSYSDGAGGAVYAEGALFEDCEFLDNVADSWNAGGSAGAISIRNGTLRRCEIRRNLAVEGQFGGGTGGGVSAGPDTVIEDCVIVGNQAAQGGGVSVTASSLGAPMENWISGTTIADNEAYAGASQLYFASATNVPGQRLYVSTSIIWGGEDCGPGDVQTFEEIGGVARLSFLCSDVDRTRVSGPMETVYGPHVIESDPLFCDPYQCGGAFGAGDYALQPTSPCLPGSSPCGALIGAIGDVCAPSNLPGNDARADGLLLQPPHPNPTRTGTQFVVSLEAAGHLRATVFDATGRRVAVVLDAQLGAGSHGVSWDLSGPMGGRVPAGVYNLRVTAAGTTQTARITIVD